MVVTAALREAEATQEALDEERLAAQAAAAAQETNQAAEAETRRSEVKTLETHALKTAKERHSDGYYSDKNPARIVHASDRIVDRRTR